MPLSSFQSRLLRLLASHRNPESYVAGAAPLARRGPRFSHDIDVFHDRELAMQEAVKADTELLQQNGFQIEWTRRFPTIFTAVIRSGDDGTLLEWGVDSAYRFFPALQDELFGYVLHPADIATNKALAAAGRREPRDIIDLLNIHERYLPLARWYGRRRRKTPASRQRGSLQRSDATDDTSRPIITGCSTRHRLMLPPLLARCGRRSTRRMRLSAQCQRARKVCYFFELMGSRCSPIRRSLTATPHMAGRCVVTGLHRRKSAER